MTAPRPWLGISTRDWFINSDTPQLAKAEMPAVVEDAPASAAGPNRSVAEPDLQVWSVGRVQVLQPQQPRAIGQPQDADRAATRVLVTDQRPVRENDRAGGGGSKSRPGPIDPPSPPAPVIAPIRCAPNPVPASRPAENRSSRPRRNRHVPVSGSMLNPGGRWGPGS